MHETSSQSDENKPVMQYEAVVTAENPVNITSEANASSSVEGIVKKEAPVVCRGFQTVDKVLRETSVSREPVK